MSSSDTDIGRDREAAEQWVEVQQGRLERAHRIADDERKRVQAWLNEVRHRIEDDDAPSAWERIDEVGPKIDRALDGKVKSTFREYAESIGLAILFAFILRGFVIEAFKIPTGSMIPTLLVGDHLFVNKFIYGIRVPFTNNYIARFEKPTRGEVVVFKFPTEEARHYLARQPISERECIDERTVAAGKDFIKRIVGTEGDTVELRDNRLIINGEPVPRDFVRKEVTGNYLYPHQVSEVEELGSHRYTIQYSGADENFGPIKVKQGHVFAMGDNRDNSSDSRCWGQVPVENIKGRAMIIWWSNGPEAYRWDRMGKVID